MRQTMVAWSLLTVFLGSLITAPAEARISQQLSTAAGDPGMSTALRSVGLLDVLSSTPASPSGRAPGIHARLRRLAAKSDENSGLGIAPQQTTAPAPALAERGQPGSQQELDAYNRLHNEPDPQTKKNLIDRFAADFPRSGLLAYVYQDGVTLGRQANNIEMMADYGDKSLELWPDNYTLLTELGGVFVQRNRVDRAEADAKRALDILAVAPRPEGMTEAQWAENKKMLLANNCTTLGFVHLRRALATAGAEARTGEAENAITFFNKALENRPLDDFTFYGLGLAYAIQNDYPNAESNLAKAVAIKGAVMASARAYLEEIYRSRHNKSLNGLDQVIARARAELGIASDIPSKPDL